MDKKYKLSGCVTYDEWNEKLLRIKEVERIREEKNLQLKKMANEVVITCENDALFKALIELNEQRHIYEEEYFPNVVKQYIDSGAVLLRQVYRYGHDFYAHLVSLEKGI